jgi:hypothetical protein
MFQTSYADAKELQELCMLLVDEGVVEYEIWCTIRAMVSWWW